MTKLDRLLLIATLASLLLGAWLALRAKPFSSPDEAAHYLRATEIAQGKWLNRKGDPGVDIPCRDYFTIAARHAPMAFYRDVTRRLDFADPGCKVRSVNTAGIYLPVSYLMLAPAEALGRALDWPIERRLVLMRFANFAGTALLFALIGWLVPRWRAPFMLVAFSPLLILLRASASADGMTAALTLLWLAWLLRLWQQARPPSGAQWATLFGLGLLLGGCKPVYGLLVFFSLLLALRPDPPRTRLRAAGLAMLMGAATLALSSALLALADPTLVQLAHGADPGAQLDSMRQHPLVFSQAVLASLGWRTFYEMVVPYPGPADAQGIAIAWTHALLLIGLLLSGPAFVAPAGRVFAALLLLLMVLAVALPLYLTYTPPGFQSVVGVQGRYLIPLTGLLMFALGGFVRPRFALPRAVAEPLAVLVPLALGGWLAVHAMF